MVVEPVRVDLSGVLTIAAIVVVAIVVLAVLVLATIMIRRAVSKAKAERDAAREAAASLALRRQTALDRINTVKDEYAAKLTDISYVIEFNALFNDKYPSTKMLTNALLSVDAPDSLGVDLLEQRANNLQARWKVAVADAEQVGYAALGDQRKARRAKLLADKSKSVTGSELDATMGMLKSLLDTLGIIVPHPTREAIEARQVLAVTAS